MERSLDKMLRVCREIRLNVSPATAWDWLSQLERLAAVNLFHQRVRFVGPYRSGAGTRLYIQHGLRVLGRVPVSMERQARVTHWEVGRAIGWVEIDPASPRGRFPHSQQFVLESWPDRPDLKVKDDAIQVGVRNFGFVEGRHNSFALANLVFHVVGINRLLASRELRPASTGSHSLLEVAT